MVCLARIISSLYNNWSTLWALKTCDTTIICNVFVVLYQLPVATKNTFGKGFCLFPDLGSATAAQHPWHHIQLQAESTTEGGDIPAYTK